MRVHVHNERKQGWMVEGVASAFAWMGGYGASNLLVALSLAMQRWDWCDKKCFGLLVLCLGEKDRLTERDLKVSL